MRSSCEASAAKRRVRVLGRLPAPGTPSRSGRASRSGTPSAGRPRSSAVAPGCAGTGRRRRSPRRSPRPRPAAGTTAGSPPSRAGRRRPRRCRRGRGLTSRSWRDRRLDSVSEGRRRPRGSASALPGRADGTTTRATRSVPPPWTLTARTASWVTLAGHGRARESRPIGRVRRAGARRLRPTVDGPRARTARIRQARPAAPGRRAVVEGRVMCRPVGRSRAARRRRWSSR